VQSRLAEQGITVSFEDSVSARMADAGFDPVYGARPLRRAIQTQIEDLLSEQLLEGKVKPGGHYTCWEEEDQLVVEEAEA